MKRNLINIFSLLVLFVFIGTLIFFGASIKNELNSSDSRTKDVFNKITYSVESNLDSLSQLNFSSGADVIQSVSVRHNNELVICFPNEEIAENTKNTNLVKVFNKSITKENDFYSVKASLYLLRPAVIYETTRVSFIVILIATLLTTGLLIYVSKTENNTALDEEGVDEEPSEEDTTEPELSEIIEETEEPLETEPQTEDESKPEDEPYTETEEEEKITFDFDEPTEESEEASEAFEVSAPVEQTESIESEAYEANNLPETDEIIQEQEENPYYQGIETKEVPETRTDFIEKLNENLSSASENEADLSLFLFEFSSECQEDMILETLNSNFGENNVAKYGNNTFASFKPNATIDEAEEFATKIQIQLADFSSNKKCFIGISSKSIRMLGADRLLMEAEEALCHAKEDPESPIIGFHVDIEKYREFIRNS